MPTLKDKIEKHPLAVVVGFILAGGGAGFFLKDTIAAVNGAEYITRAEKQAIDQAEEDLDALKRSATAKDQEIANAKDRIKALTGENLKLKDRAEDLEDQAKELRNQTASVSKAAMANASAQCKKEVGDAVAAREAQIKQNLTKSLEERLKPVNDLVAQSKIAIEQREAIAVQLKACMFEGKGSASYPAFKKAELTISFAANRAQDALVIAKKLTPYFADVDLSDCYDRCSDKASIRYAADQKVGAGADLAALLVDMGYAEFERPKITTGSTNGYFSMTLR